MKECSTCGAMKQLENFTKGKGECKDCRNYKRTEKYKSERTINENLTCAECGYTAHNKDFLEIHNRIIHGEKSEEVVIDTRHKKVKCDLCGRYVLNKNVEKHQKCKTCLSVQNGERRPFSTVIREIPDLDVEKQR